jgi:hypothetical protein
MPAPVARAKLRDVGSNDEQQDDNKLYATYADLVGYHPDYAHAPSCARKDAAERQNVPALKAQYIRATIEYQNCFMPRALYATKALAKISRDLHPEEDSDYAESQLECVRNDQPQYICGSPPFPDDHSLAQLVYCNSTLACRSPVKASLCSVDDSVLLKLSGNFELTLCMRCGIRQVPVDK